MKIQINSTERHNFEKALFSVAKDVVISTRVELYNGHLGDRGKWPL